MNFLADESVDGPVVDRLREDGNAPYCLSQRWSLAYLTRRSWPWRTNETHCY
jgi:hypothetical protein